MEARGMNFIPESTVGTSPDRTNQIITRKPTDHRIPTSPTSTSYRGGIASLLVYSKTSDSPTMSSEEEEEDMANCLILLAQSQSPINEPKSDLNSHKAEKMRFRSVTEMAADESTGGSSGFQSYECKTCSRAFPSFQALGGHRASHKKPKLATEERNFVFIKTDLFSKEGQPKLAVDYEENKVNINNADKSSSLAVTVTGGIQAGFKNSKVKIHECSICGSEFLSGQALGGHMRRHRTPPPSINQIAISTNMNDSSGHHITGKSPMISLDLNLPAPEVADEGHSNFQFTASSSQKPLVFSAAALVDCHY